MLNRAQDIAIYHRGIFGDGRHPHENQIAARLTLEQSGLYGPGRDIGRTQEGHDACRKRDSECYQRMLQAFV
jgi:hypothetical protein